MTTRRKLPSQAKMRSTFQRRRYWAPVRRIQRMPSTIGLKSCGGRPWPSSRRGWVTILYLSSPLLTYTKSAICSSRVDVNVYEADARGWVAPNPPRD